MPQPPRGRGAAGNPTVRYDRLHHEAVDDGWDLPDDAPPLRTEITVDATRTVIARNASPDLPFDRSLNPIRGCEHGCVYCYARPSHAQLGLSPGLDFETRLIAKPDAPRLLDAELRRRGYAPAVLAIGTETDPYQPAERGLRIMRGVLGVLAAFNHPVMITTKGAGVTRDLDLLGPMGRAGLAQVGITLTTLDPRLSRAMEPRAAAPARRLAAMEAAARAGIPVHVLVSPVIPAVNDHEIERLLAAARDAGATSAGSILLRLPGEVNGLFRDWLARELPDRAARVMKLVRETRGGRDNDPRFGHRMRGQGPYAALLRRRFELARDRLGYAPPVPLRTDLFRPPPRPGDQLDLFAGAAE